MAAKRHSGLGKGLDVLMATKPTSLNRSKDWDMAMLDVTSIQVGRYQPRQHFDQDALEELADSIKAQGLVQPVIVRLVAEQQYELIAGERRWRAAQLAGLSQVPAVIRELEDQQALAMALIENIQRKDLNPLEEAQALARLLTEFELTHQEVAEAVGRSRSAVTNLLRLLKLPELLQDWLQDGLLSMGHVRALLTLEGSDQVQLAQQAIDEGWSVRQIEQAIQQRDTVGVEVTVQDSPVRTIDPNISALEQQLAEQLGAKVKIKHHASGRGKMEIIYSDLEELQHLLGRIK
ncbi:chromosome partitioning protein ParB [Thiomicrospira aerophila AL3]|uniref:Probable chromosome-partitioning protein ParB n=1 Tax=Thiomicrospira aerophila AL3 TaxID=717772 RepID=W0DUH0_9GAMM|nr:ParB/RepB/Spo0J family partition protein [Thiomicrospira aerophila]AHF02092.1 chromosome partitioning protein ParB [Thiomicrospira aerophila AL3]